MVLSNITILSSITSKKDGVLDDQVKGVGEFIMFTDQPVISETWRVLSACDKFKDARRNSRIHKILPHTYCNTEYSIWIDGNIKLLKTPEELIEKYLRNHDIAVFRHPVRNCIYDEAMECAKRGLDDPENIIEQAKYYEDSGYAKQKGLCECGIILRRHTKKVQEFNESWWAEYCRFSRRDQISFMYAVDKVGIRVNMVPEYFVEKDGRFTRADDFEIVPHKHFL